MQHIEFWFNSLQYLFYRHSVLKSNQENFTVRSSVQVVYCRLGIYVETND